MPNLLFQFLTIATNILIIAFATYYFLKLRAKEKEIENKETKIDTSYHQIVDTALAKERKILDDAITEADQILKETEFIKNSSNEAIKETLNKLVIEIQKKSIETSSVITESYTNSLKNITANSLTDFQNISKVLQEDLHRQIKDFRQSLLPSLEKELEEYKRIRIQQSEAVITKIVQKASQDIFSKTINSDDHQKLLKDALEKAKAEGIFN